MNKSQIYQIERSFKIRRKNPGMSKSEVRTNSNF